MMLWEFCAGGLECFSCDPGVAAGVLLSVGVVDVTEGFFLGS